MIKKSITWLSIYMKGIREKDDAKSRWIS